MGIVKVLAGWAAAAAHRVAAVEARKPCAAEPGAVAKPCAAEPGAAAKPRAGKPRAGKPRAAAALAACLAASLVAGCASSGDSTAGDDSSSTLVIGALGSTTDALNPFATQGFADYIGIGHLYRSLVKLEGGKVEMDLAESIEPDEKAQRWTISIKPHQTFSHGVAITASDVAASLKLLADPDVSTNYAQFYSDLDANGIEVVDQNTVVVPLKRPRVDFVESVLAFASYVILEGATDWRQPISSGDYTLYEYHPGSRIVLHKRENLGEDSPEIDTLDIRVIDDPQARLNALQSGEIDFATRVDPVMVESVAGNPELALNSGGSESAQVLGFEMNVNEKPFDDPRVREALRLAIDRQEMVDTILFGHGEVGNDLVGLGLPGYATTIPQRDYDPERARRLFAEAGVTRLAVRAADTTPGLVAAADLLAEQLAEVGVILEVDNTDPAAFYADFDTLLSTPLQTSYYINRSAPSFLGAFTGSFGYFNISGFNPPGYDDAIRKAQATVEHAARTAQFDELQQQQWDDGGMLLWGYQPVLNLHRAELEGVQISQGVPMFGDAHWKN